MKQFIQRTLKNCNCETRENNGERWIVGLIPYNSRSENLCPWNDSGEYEIIDNTAFNKTLADGAEVRALFSHDDQKVLGSTKSGSLILEQSDEGLICRCKVPNTTWGNDCWEIVSRGDVTTMSFGFIKYDTYNEGNITHLRSVKLLEVSFAVANPAYPETQSFTQIRQLIERAINENELEKTINTTESEIKDLISTLQRLLPKEESAVETDKPDDEQSDDTPPENPDDTEELEKLQTLCEIEINS